MSCKNENVKYLLCVIDAFPNYAWVKPLKDKKVKTVLNAFIEIVNEYTVKWNIQIYCGLIKEDSFTINLKWLENNILLYSTHNAGKSLIAEGFIKTLKAKIEAKMTANDSIFYLSYLNKSLDQYINTYHHSINKKPNIVDYYALTEKMRRILKLINLKWMAESELLSIRIFLQKGYTENWSREIFIINSVLKANPWTYQIKDLNGGKIMGSFNEKELLLSKL